MTKYMRDAAATLFIGTPFARLNKDQIAEVKRLARVLKELKENPPAHGAFIKLR